MAPYLMSKGRGAATCIKFAIVAVVIEMTVSANLLTWIGIPYVSEGGIPALKLHPGSDLLTLAVALALASSGSGWLYRLPATLWIFFVSAGSCIVFVSLLSGPGNTIVLMDTFLPAGMLAAVFAHADETELCLLRRLIQGLVACNAVLALVEAAGHFTLIPLYLNDAAYHAKTGEFRPTALFDHPLTGAIIMMIGLALTPAGSLRRPYQGLLLAALIAFGGRMAIGVSLVSAVLRFTHANFRLVLARDARAGGAILLAACCSVVVAILSIAMVSLGLGDRLVGHLHWDQSAQVRLAQWQILDRLSSSQILFGTPRDQLLANLNALRLATGVEVIENFWLLMFVSLGLLSFPFFIILIGSLCLWCWSSSDRQGRVLLMSVLTVASSSNSLGRKSTVLVCLVAAICTLRRCANGFGRERAEAA